LKGDTDLSVGVPWKLIVLWVVIAGAGHFRGAVDHPVYVALGVACVELAAAGLG